MKFDLEYKVPPTPPPPISYPVCEETCCLIQVNVIFCAVDERLETKTDSFLQRFSRVRQLLAQGHHLQPGTQVSSLTEEHGGVSELNCCDVIGDAPQV